MRSITATARAMNDADLERKELELRQQIPAAQSLLDAIKRERRARKRRSKQQGER